MILLIMSDLKNLHGIKRWNMMSKTRLFPRLRITLFLTLNTNIPILFFHSKCLLSDLFFNGIHFPVRFSVDGNLMSIMCYPVHDGVSHHRIRKDSYPVIHYTV